MDCHQVDNREKQVHIALALRNTGESIVPKAESDSKIRWDEETIAEHDKLRGTRQKINEPDTPYNFESQSDMSDYESGDSGSRNSVVATSPGTEKGRNELEKVIRAVRLRLPDADRLDKERIARWDDIVDKNSEVEDQDHFREKRAQHYNEYRMMHEWKQRHSKDEDDEYSDDEKTNGHNKGAHDFHMDTSVEEG